MTGVCRVQRQLLPQHRPARYRYRAARQKVLDSTTGALVTALNVANNSDTLRRQFSVTFKYVVDDAAPITVSKDQSYFYGTVGTFTVPRA